MRKTTRTKLAISGVVGAAVIGLVIQSSIANGSRQTNVDDVATGPTAWLDTEVKVAGWVEPGSIVEKVVNQEMHRTFVMYGYGRKKLRVFSVGPKPDTFKDQSQVVSTGRVVPASSFTAEANLLGARIDGDYVVDASDLSSKCPDHYDAPKLDHQLVDYKPFTTSN
jgi:cytochrome c-type biogenesis protein CcmE